MSQASFAVNAFAAFYSPAEHFSPKRMPVRRRKCSKFKVS
jgi:hypothetical protein